MAVAPPPSLARQWHDPYPGHAGPTAPQPSQWCWFLSFFALRHHMCVAGGRRWSEGHVRRAVARYAFNSGVGAPCRRAATNRGANSVGPGAAPAGEGSLSPLCKSQATCGCQLH